MQAALNGQGADTTMAVPNMLEIVPRGINKWVGMQLLLEDLGIGRESLMSCGDGSNDLQLVSNSGIGVAMGNAVPAVRHSPHSIRCYIALTCNSLARQGCYERRSLHRLDELIVC